MSRPQYLRSCGISALVSSWNFLFSTLGSGQKRAITVDEVLVDVLGFQPPFDEIGFGAFTGNDTLVKWFYQINEFYGVQGESAMLYKAHGKNVTAIDETVAHDNLVEGLLSHKKAYVYHCQNHYLCPIGFEHTPTQPHDAFAMNKKIGQKFETWIIIGDISAKYPPIQVCKWAEIVKDITCVFPYYYDIREPKLGIQKKEGEFSKARKKKGNQHCIIEFRSL